MAGVQSARGPLPRVSVTVRTVWEYSYCTVVVPGRTPCPPPGHTVLYEYSYRIAVWALLERHITRCPLGAVKYSMHRGLAYVVARLLRQAGAAKTDIVFEVSNLRAGDKTRPGDVVWLHVLRPGQHLLIDVSITGV